MDYHKGAEHPPAGSRSDGKLNTTESRPGESVPPEVYTREYYLNVCEGNLEFVDSRGRVLSDRLEDAMKTLSPVPGERILDVGCGRGEVVTASARTGAQVVGVDYAPDALLLSKETLSESGQDDAAKVALLLSNAKFLPFRDNSFDKVVMLDLVEHLYPNELDLVLQLSLIHI